MRIGHVRTPKILTAALVGVGLVGAAGFTSLSTAAVESSTSKDVTVGIDTVLSITAPPSVTLDITPSASDPELKTVSTVVTVGTNNITGYTLYMSIDNTTTNALVNQAQTSLTIPTLSGETTIVNFPVNQWGYSKNDPMALATFLPLPAVGSSDTLNETTGPAAESNTDVTFGTKINMSVASGTYSNVAKFTAVTKEPPVILKYAVHYDANGGSGVPADEEHRVTSFDDEPDYTFTLTEGTTPIRSGYTFGGWTTVATNQAGAYSPGSELYLKKASPEITLYAIWVPNSEMRFGSLSGSTAKMQNMTSTICSNVSQGTTGRLQDTRDYKIYYVTKLKDNKCWMTQNLALEINENKTYTNSDTNLPDAGSWYPGDAASKSTYKSTIPYNKLSSSTWQNETSYQYSYNPGDSYYQPAAPLTTADEAETTSGDPHYASGDLYNWTAAKATNNSINQTTYASSSHDSICPKGWTLPSANSAAPSDFASMLFAQGIIDSQTTTFPNYTDGTPGGFDLVRSDPVYWVRAGYIYGGSRNSAGYSGSYWPSTASIGGSSAYYVGFTSSSVGPRSSSSRYYGRSVRCIALNENNPQPVNPDNPGGGGDTENNVNNVYNNVYNSSSTSDGANTDAADGYTAPQGVFNSTTENQPNWFLIICLSILSLLLLLLIAYLIYRLYKEHKKDQNSTTPTA